VCAWVVGDQALSGLTNVAATVVVARSVSSQEFGAYSVGFVVYILALGVVRGLVSQPLAVRFSTAAVPRDQVAGAAGATLASGGAMGLVVVAVGILLRGDTGAVLVVVGALLPALLLQDMWRFLFFTSGEPHRAVAIDLFWAGMQVVLMGSVVVLDGGLAALTAAWAGAGTVAATLGIRQTRVRPDLRLAMPFLRAQADIGPWFATEFVFQTGSSQVTTLVLGALIGTVGIGAIRGGQTLFGPFYMTMTGLMSAAIPEGARVLSRTPRRVVPLLRSMSAALVVVALIWGMVVELMPDAWGRALLGDTWEGAHELVLPLVVGAVGHGVASGGVTGLRIVAAARESFRVRVVVGTATLVAGVAGGVVGDVQGAMWGLAAGSWATAVGTWWTFGRAGSPGSRAPAVRTAAR